MSAKSSSSRHLKIVMNSPVTLTFTFLCIVSLILNHYTGGKTKNFYYIYGIIV